MAEITIDDESDSRYTEIDIDGVKNGSISFDEETCELIVRGYEEYPPTEVLKLPEE
jgi:hypothetical protein